MDWIFIWTPVSELWKVCDFQCGTSLSIASFSCHGIAKHPKQGGKALSLFSYGSPKLS